DRRELVVVLVSASQAEPGAGDRLVLADVRVRERRRAARQAHVVAADRPRKRTDADRRRDGTVVDLVGRREADGGRLRRDVRRRGLHRERVVALVGASEGEAGTGDRLALARVLVVERRRRTRRVKADILALDDAAAERGAGDRGVAVSVVDLVSRAEATCQLLGRDARLRA